jgi:hypothetical protein
MGRQQANKKGGRMAALCHFAEAQAFQAAAAVGRNDSNNLDA